jgi:hypothetical protein
MQTRTLIGLLIIALLAACAGPAPVNQGQVNQGQVIEDGSLSLQQRAACEESGGKVQRGGMLGYEACIRGFADADQRCRDDRDCEGQCFAADDPAPGQPGRCQRTTSPFGCRAAVRDGVVQPTLCVD